LRRRENLCISKLLYEYKLKGNDMEDSLGYRKRVLAPFIDTFLQYLM
jgi:hypothetical protein